MYPVNPEETHVIIGSSNHGMWYISDTAMNRTLNLFQVHVDSTRPQIVMPYVILFFFFI